MASPMASVDMSFSKLWGMVKDREDWHAAAHRVAKSWTRLSEHNNEVKVYQRVFYTKSAHNPLSSHPLPFSYKQKWIFLLSQHPSAPSSLRMTLSSRAFHPRDHLWLPKGRRIELEGGDPTWMYLDTGT